MLVGIAEFGSGAYKFVFVLHLLAAIVGFGGLIAAGIFGARSASRGGVGGAAVFDEATTVRWPEWVVYAVPVLGIILVMLSDDAWKFSQTWISLSFVLFFVYVGVYHGLHRPNLRRMNTLMAELSGESAAGATTGTGPPQARELAERGQRAAIFGAVLNVLLVALVAIMVWKPGL